MKRFLVLFAVLISVGGLTACGNDNRNVFNAADRDEIEKLHEDILGENIRRVNIDGDARSIVIRQSADDFFAFINGDLNDAHTYEVLCDVNDGMLDVRVLMENAEDNNDVLGSVIIDIPQIEFEMIEVHGGFGQISLDTLDSDVWVHANDGLVYLDLEADRLEHDITLDGSGTDTFRGVSVYLDAFPEDVKMEFDLLEGGTINDPENILENGLKLGSGKPVISIRDTKEINLW